MKIDCDAFYIIVPYAVNSTLRQ